MFLPLQEDVFPDQDDFGRIFRNNAVMCAAAFRRSPRSWATASPAAAYLPVMCDTLLMTEGSGLYLAGPALVKAAIGQEVTTRSSAAHRCTPPSAARSTSASRTTRRACIASARWPAR